MIDDKDIVNDIFSRVREILGPEFKGNIKVKLEREESEIRRHWGGANAYIKKRDKEGNIRKDVENMVKAGNPVSKIAKESGLCRATIYNLLKKK